VRVELAATGMPLRVDLRGHVAPRGTRTPREPRWTEVIDIAEVWRIGEEWWRERPIRRTYFTLVVEEGRSVTVFRDELGALGSLEAGEGWFEQRY
jgi:hypothetical protein